MPRVLLFGPARDLAGGAARTDLDGTTVGEVVAAGAARFGPAFADLCERSQVWVNGDPAAAADAVAPADEIAVLPPVSGG
ncbi:MAG: MoaD/ThiS family protein [Acidimicrobiales bacterium]